MPSRGNWKRLGQLLYERRHELGYPVREAFVEEKGLRNSRVVSDLENAKRTNFSRGTLLEIEDVYGWQRNSIQQVLDGGEPTPIQAAEGVTVRDLRPTPAKLRREIRASVDRVLDADLIRVRDFIDGLVRKD